MHINIEELDKEYEITEFVLKVKNSIIFKN